jgi:flotillin
MSTVKLPAEAESFRLQTIAEGKRTQTLEAARADAERTKKLGTAEASAIELVRSSWIENLMKLISCE